MSKRLDGSSLFTGINSGLTNAFSSLSNQYPEGVTLENIAKRTGGDIYLGVVGAVRAGNLLLLGDLWRILLFQIFRMNLRRKER